MKKLMTILGVVLAITMSAQAYEITVTTNSAVAIPNQKVNDGTVWTNGLTVAQGDYVVSTNSTPEMVYFAITAGTAANEPSHTTGVATGADTIQWLALNVRYRTAKRSNAILFADENAAVYYARGTTATTGDGILDYLRPARSFPEEQGSISVITASGTATVNVELKKGNH